YQSWEAPYPWEQGERFVREIMTRHPDMAGGWVQVGVKLRAGGAIIGDCAALPEAGEPPPGENGFSVPPRYYGGGLATAARGPPAGGLLVHRPGQAPRHRLLRRAECGVGRTAGTPGHAAGGSPSAEHLGQGRVDR